VTSKRVLVLSGDGIGPEVTAQGVKVLRALAGEAGLALELDEGLLGGVAIDATGDPLPPETLEKALAADAVLFGANGGPKWDTLAVTPGHGFRRLRAELKLYANLRPVVVYDELLDASAVRPELARGTDFLVIRELIGGIYYGEPRGIREEAGGRYAVNTMLYREEEIERIVRLAFETARARRRRVTSVDKANVLEVSRFWREIAGTVAAAYPDVTLEHLYVDNAALQLIRAPGRFDVIVTGNLFGDILSDEAAALMGSLGMMPSASLGERHALYEPVHGSAPDIEGQDVANPLASILSVGLMLHHTFGRPELDARLREAVRRVLTRHRTADIRGVEQEVVGCERMGDLVVEALARAA